jgi:ABC-type dipeptide/oligopeptide/nickel transport system permease component
MLPNVMPALAGQMRARVLHLLSGAVVVEVVLGLPGVGDLLWSGTLLQDFGVVLAAATSFAAISGGLLCLQALVEIAVALHVRRAPAVEGA